MSHNKNKKLYEVTMTSMCGTYSAGKFYGRNRQEAAQKAEKANGDIWTYYIGKYLYKNKEDKQREKFMENLHNSLRENPKFQKKLKEITAKFNDGTLQPRFNS